MTMKIIITALIVAFISFIGMGLASRDKGKLPYWFKVIVVVGYFGGLLVAIIASYALVWV